MNESPNSSKEHINGQKKIKKKKQKKYKKSNAKKKDILLNTKKQFLKDFIIKKLMNFTILKDAKNVIMDILDKFLL